MRRIIALSVVLSLAAFVPGEEEKAKPNTLTAKEAAAGWLLLFDGESTFGWSIDGASKVEKGVLILGGNKETKAEPTAWLGNRMLSLEFNWSGDKAPGLDFGPGKKGTVVLPESKGAKFTRLTNSREYTPPIEPRPPLRITVPAGTTLKLHSIQVRPMKTESLFNGKDLKGWKVHPGRKSKFTVTEEGWLNVKNGAGDLQTEKQFGDFILRLDCISNGKHLNSGIFFRCIPGKYQLGYECQIRNEFKDKNQKYTIEEHDPKTHKLMGKKTVMSPAVDYGTGGIYRRMPARRVVAKDKEWFTLTILARQRHFMTWVNGIPVAEWTDNRADNANPRQGYRAAAGAISIQGHDPTTDLSFRNFKVAELVKKKEE